MEHLYIQRHEYLGLLGSPSAWQIPLP